MSLAESITGVAGKVLDKFVQDKDLKAKLDQEMKMAFHEANLAQIELNKEEAKSSSLFVSGWRPFVGWTCGVALAYHFILEPFIKFIVVINGVDVELPTFDFSQLSSILMGMLGLGGLRTYEKMKKVERNNV
jgi:hypothetical protein|tara:strand:- start:382 stop:777 length:396 start_codon:yes stop_codon:yes gene_type:complete